MSTILITGASHGVGKAFAIACAQSGRFSKIILNGGTDTAALEDTARRVSAAGDLVCLADVGDVSDLAYVQGLRERFGPVDTLVNNAGISRIGLLTDMSPDVWDRVLKVNVTSLYNTCHTYVPDMVSNGGGQILNVSSVWGLCGASCEVAYSASKGAVNAFTKALAKELAPSHIRVNAIALGIIGTRMNAHLTETETAEICDQIPAGYIASPEDAAQAMLRLLDMPEYFNGEIVRFDGCWI
ncbi:SDR family NAD(P)-dependent oxidoreductase [Aristaeella hokkaidonensis]|uniref:SDR family NAD(P)-dependent oxidoreductase n=1 Tax=Aristaeella hokkaidonensis TaxID=3046382 RepID=A0AC61N4Y9_9FIRM|nr:SDR family NAD(P)-dependent oxidoreductase [Aristaeella hokkaidonensis]QUC66274.1 SDR family NAD(P)-dependent oxidoreductase [Aristaeella hokkaidonensis]SNT94318.1 3-oxoacyl-[acyl-carrier protein] reductase [Aristaeella hokkaidonensis]